MEKRKFNDTKEGADCVAFAKPHNDDIEMDCAAA
jgi:hypothetical protein